MIEMLMQVCLMASPEVCATRFLPGPCLDSRAEAWVADRPDLRLAGTRCAAGGDGVTPMDVAEIAPGVFVHHGEVALTDAENGGDIANIGFVIGDSAVAVIDAGGSRAVGESLYGAIRARTDLPIRWLVLTHMHPDHVFGAEVFAEAGATVVGHSRLPAALANRAANYTDALTREAGPVAAMASRIMLPDDTVETARSLDLGGRELLLEAWPTAHTDNDLTVFDTVSGTWWMGDLVFDGHTPAVDGSALGWIGLLDRLSARSAARIVPGHGRPSLSWPQGAEATRDYLVGLVEDTRAALAAGDSLGQAAERIGADLQGQWQLFDDFNARNATTVYHELEWE
jgi:quinoprotein relay system zinc metallohydrolase 2